ncbi:TBCC domain-containing protein 1 [Globodera pallida]|nr:TBCC domain-containing protein 1 [Globodera pallida]
MKNKYIVIRDEHSKLFGHRFLNSQLSLYLGSIQLLFCLWALTQHIWSMASLNKAGGTSALRTFKRILYCDFSPNSTLPPLLTHVDAIIFDIGLFHNLWGISGCVAQHLDGGYGRFCWCIAHSAALLFCLPLAFVSRPKPNWLWPLLIQQSAYGVGMLILSLAALPRAAHFLGDVSNAPVKAIVFYSFGTLMNFFLLYVYWHWYWHVETLWNSARKLRRGETFTGSTTKRPIRRCSPVGVGRAPLLEVTTTGKVPIKNGTIGEGAGRMTRPTGRLPNECAVKGGGTEEHKGEIGSAEAAGHLLSVGVENARNARAVQTGARGGHLDNNHANVARSPDDVLGGERLQKRRRESPSLLEGMDRSNSPNSFHSLGSTTASSIASTTTSSTTTQQKPIRKPPPPAPSPAVDAPDQEKCRSHYPNHHRTSCLNELTLSPRVRHLRREGSRHVQQHHKHLHTQLHHQNHSQKRSSGRLRFSSSVKGPDPPLTEAKFFHQKDATVADDRSDNEICCLAPVGGPERGIDQRSLGLGVGNGLINPRKMETSNWRSKLWTGTTEIGSVWGRDSDGASGVPSGAEPDIAGRDNFGQTLLNGWTPSMHQFNQKRTSESSTTTCWSSTNDHLLCPSLWNYTNSVGLRGNQFASGRDGTGTRRGQQQLVVGELVGQSNAQRRPKTFIEFPPIRQNNFRKKKVAPIACPFRLLPSGDVWPFRHFYATFGTSRLTESDWQLVNSKSTETGDSDDKLETKVPLALLCMALALFDRHDDELSAEQFVRENAALFCAIFVLTDPQTFPLLGVPLPPFCAAFASVPPFLLDKMPSTVRLPIPSTFDLVFEGTLLQKPFESVDSTKLARIRPEPACKLLAKWGKMPFLAMVRLFSSCLQSDVFQLSPDSSPTYSCPRNIPHIRRSLTAVRSAPRRRLLLEGWGRMEILSNSALRGGNIRLRGGRPTASAVFHPLALRTAIVADCVKAGPIVFGPIFGFLLIRHCKNITISAICSHIQLDCCHNVTLFCQTADAIAIRADNCSKITLGPYNVFFDGLKYELDAVGMRLLSVEENVLLNPFEIDKNELPSSESVWKALGPEQFYLYPTPFRENCGTSFWRKFVATVPSEHWLCWQRRRNEAKEIARGLAGAVGTAMGGGRRGQDAAYLAKKAAG